MKKKVYCLVLLVFSFLLGNAFELSVEVRDTDGLPLPGATVKIENLTDSVIRYVKIANSEGKADFSDLKPDPYYLTVSMTGMDSVVKKLDLK